jgi:hypothetical protein
LEHAQRLLALPTRSWLSRMRYRFGSRAFRGGRSAGSRDAEARDIPAGFGLVASVLPAAVLATLATSAA